MTSEELEQKLKSAVKVSRNTLTEFAVTLRVINGRRAEARKDPLSTKGALEILMNLAATETTRDILINS